MANAIYNSFKAKIMDGSIDLDTDTVKLALVTSSYTPNVDTDEFYSDVTANEVEGTGYTAGGAEITSKAVTADTTDDEGVFDGADVTWSTSTITAAGAVVYKDTGTATESPLICYFDFGGDKTSSAGNFVVSWNAEGILNLG